jgi:hypothetical protein
MCTRIQRNPGKFEGEGCITKAAWEWAMDGMGDELGDTEEETPTVFNGPFTVADSQGMCKECKVALKTTTKIELYESSNGFVTTVVS